MTRAQQTGLRQACFSFRHRADRFEKAIASRPDIVCLHGGRSSRPGKAGGAMRVLGSRQQSPVRDRGSDQCIEDADGNPKLVASGAVGCISRPDRSAQGRIGGEVVWVSGLLGESRLRGSHHSSKRSKACRGWEPCDDGGRRTVGPGTADLAADMGVTMDWNRCCWPDCSSVQAAAGRAWRSTARGCNSMTAMAGVRNAAICCTGLYRKACVHRRSATCMRLSRPDKSRR